MKIRKRVVTFALPEPGTTKDIYQGADGWKFAPKIGEEVIIADLSGTGKIVLGRVTALDKKAHTYTVMSIRYFQYSEDDPSLADSTAQQ